MGVYIPPPNDDDSKNPKPKPKPTDAKPNPNITHGGSSSSSSSGSTTIVIPNPATWFPRNPSVGLVWGPLVPASDNLPALYLMIGLQLVSGMYCLRKARQIFRPPIPIGSGTAYGQQISNTQYASPIKPRGSLWRSLIPGIAGAGAIFGAGLEITRMSLPYDPWYEEAKYYRRLASKNGDTPSSWFGAYKYYVPMDMNTWTDKVGDWIKNVEREVIEDAPTNVATPGTGVTPMRGSVLSKLNKNGKYTEIYNRLLESNATRQKTLLEEDLKDVNELNKAERIDLILEGKSPYVNPYYTKPHIQLGNHSIETDDDFYMVWFTFDPWDELKLETDYDIRLIPRWNWINDEDVKQNDEDIIETLDTSV